MVTGEEDEAHGDRGQHERRHGQVHEGVDVLDHPGHVGDAIQVEDAEVVDVDEGEGHEEQELRPLRGVAQEDLEVLDQQAAGGRPEGQPGGHGFEPAEAGEPGLAGLLGLAPAVEVESVEGGSRAHREGERGRP
jgi:hypothetical protein